MKIAYIVEAVNVSGGYDRVIIEKTNYSAEHGYDVTITVASHALEISCIQFDQIL